MIAKKRKNKRVKTKFEMTITLEDNFELWIDQFKFQWEDREKREIRKKVPYATCCRSSNDMRHPRWKKMSWY